jgi:hypothetical protein
MFLCGCVEIFIFIISSRLFFIRNRLLFLAAKEFACNKCVKQFLNIVKFFIQNSEIIITCYCDTIATLHFRQHDPLRFGQVGQH